MGLIGARGRNRTRIHDQITKENQCIMNPTHGLKKTEEVSVNGRSGCVYHFSGLKAR